METAPGLHPELQRLETRRRRIALVAWSLLGLLLLAGALVILQGWRRAVGHARASAHFRERGGRVDWEWDAGRWRDGGVTRVTLTRPSPGEPSLARLRDAGIKDADLWHLRDLNGLEEVGLYGCDQVSDEGLKALAGLTGLKELYLGSSETPMPRVTDAGLAHLASLTGLRVLSLAGTKITDEGLAHLRNLRELEYLDLESTKVTDAGLARLRALPRLEILGLDKTGVTAQGVWDLRRARPELEIHLDGLDESMPTPEVTAP